MAWLYQTYINQFLVFTLVFVRISGLVITAPIYGGNDVPARVRALLAFALALLVAPLQWGRQLEYPDNTLNYLVYVGGELLLGITLGLGIMLLFSGVQVAGQVISQLGGMQLADVFNPGLDTSVPVFAQLMYYVTLAVFVIIGGHRRVMEALLDTFVAIPPGGGISSSIIDTLTTLLTQSFTLGLRAAAPATAALLLATLVMGLVSRTLPQLNVMAIGFGLNSFITLGVLSVTLGAAAWVFQEQVDPMLEMIVGAMQG
jgi:flagellar biosynthesis protein FliR